MTRSLKKGPFVDHHLMVKAEKAVSTNDKKTNQNLVASFHHPARIHWAHHRGAQRPATRAGVHHRPNGGAQVG
jgi:hypothetical protein